MNKAKTGTRFFGEVEVTARVEGDSIRLFCTGGEALWNMATNEWEYISPGFLSVCPVGKIKEEMISTGHALKDIFVPTIVCLCGSVRFRQAYRDANLRETLEGKIVLAAEIFDYLSRTELDLLARLHFRKIDLADEILILNVGGYIGESTQIELDYAIGKGKIVRFLC